MSYCESSAGVRSYQFISGVRLAWLGNAVDWHRWEQREHLE